MIPWSNGLWRATLPSGAIISPANPWNWFLPSYIVTTGQEAYLYADHSERVVNHWDGKTYHCKVGCGVLSSVQSYGYGTFSAEIKLPRGKNLWPAFWLLGEGEWPQNGEVDICEAWTPYFRLFTWKTTHDIHFEQGNEHQHIGSHNTPIFYSPCPTSNYVKYEVEWRKDRITFKVNGHRIRTYDHSIARHLQDKRMYVIFDLWTTGEDFRLDSPMIIKNFEYKPIEIL